MRPIELAGVLLLALAVLPLSDCAGQHESRLEVKDGSAYENYAYAAYELEVEAGAGRLSVSVKSRDLDSYLILRSPDGEFRKNDIKIVHAQR